MSLLCLEYKVCSIPYFMDNMRYYELKPILKNLNVSVKNDWEIARQISYIIAQSQSTKKIKPSDIMQFPWDEGYKNRPKKDVKLTKEMRDRMIMEMEANKELLIKNNII